MSDNPYISTFEHPDLPVPAKKKRRWGTVLMLVGIGVVLVALMLPSVRMSREAARRMQCSNQLKQIALALQNYEEVYGALPPAYTVDAEGQPLHSWRTLILPFIEQNELYEKIDLSKTWDDPVNAEAFKIAISPYRCPSADCPADHTTYLAVVAPGSGFQSAESRLLAEITDEPQRTLLVIEAPRDQSVPWMAPQDANEELIMAFGPNSQFAHEGGVLALFVDGSVQFLSADLPANQRRALITIAGGEVVGDDD